MILVLLVIFLLITIQNFSKRPSTISGEALVINVREKEYSNLITIKFDNKKYNFYTNDNLLSGDIIKIDAKVLSYDKQTIPHAFNSYIYYRSINVFGYLKEEKYSKNGTSFIVKTLYNFRSSLTKDIQLDVLRYINSFIFKNNTLDEELNSQFSELGIIHLISLSGIHIMVILIFIKKIMFHLNIDTDYQEKIILVILVLFLVLTSFSLTILRLFLYYLFIYIFRKNNITISNFNIMQLVFLVIFIMYPHLLYSSNFLVMYLLVTIIRLMKPLYKYNNIINTIIISVVASLILLPFTKHINITSIFIMPLYFMFFTYILYPLSIIIIIIPKLSYILRPIFISIPFIFNYIESGNNLSIKIGALSSLYIVIYYILLYSIIKYSSYYKKMASIILIIALLLKPIIKRNIINPRLYFLDVGQGDSVVYISQNLVFVVDCYQYVSTFLEDMGINKIDYLFITHSDSDHGREASDLIRKFDVINVVLSGYDTYNINHSNISYITGYEKLVFNDNIFEFFGPLKVYNSANNNSLVFKFSNEYNDILFTGDIEKEAELDLVEKYGNSLSSNILKVAHHGSLTSSTDAFINAVSPQHAVISLGRNNRHNFPSNEVISKFYNNDIWVYRTDLDNTIILYNNKLYKYASLTMKNKLFIV